MIDRNGKFISKGDVVKPLTSGRYKGQRVKVIEIDDNKISLKPIDNEGALPSWRLAHNVLKIE